MATRGAALTVTFQAINSTTGAPVTGDAANITPRKAKDGVSSALTNGTVTEVDATNIEGLYSANLTGAESDCNLLTVGGKSSTANVIIIPVHLQMERLPDAAPGGSGGVPTADASNGVALTSGERTTLAGVVWSALTSGLTTAGSIGKRVVDYLTGDAFARLGAPAGASVSADVAAIKSETASIQSDTDALQTDVTTLLSRLSSTRAGYLDNLATAPPTASQITTAVWAAAARTLTEKTGFSLTTAPPTAAEIKTAMEATGGLLELANTRVQLALPAFAPGNNSGVARKSDVASGGGGSAGTQLIAMPTRLAIEGQYCSTDRLATISLQSGSSLAYEVQLVDAAGAGVPTTSTTLSAKIVDGADPLAEDLAIEEVLASQGRITVVIDTRVSGLAGITYATLVVTRDNGDSDVTTYPAQLFIER